jgi:hypothetical protein
MSWQEVCLVSALKGPRHTLIHYCKDASGKAIFCCDKFLGAVATDLYLPRGQINPDINLANFVTLKSP